MTTDERSRMERILDPAFVSNLDDVPSPELRRRIADAREEEDALSYQRRLIHAQLDILGAERERREGGGAASAEETVDRLKQVLNKGGGGSRGARTRLYAGVADHQALEGAEQMVSEDFLARLPDLEESEIIAAVERLVEAERPLSETRRKLHDVIDALEAELVGRYKSGTLSPSDVLGGDPEDGD